MLKAMLALFLIFPGIIPLCGQTEQDRHEIRGGHKLPSDKYLFATYVEFRDGSYCTGSLSAPTWVLTADPGTDLAIGAVYLEQETGCAAESLQVESRYLITSKDGQIMEVFSVLPQTDSDWLSDGDCRILSNSFGSRDNIGLAMVTAQPGESAPSGTKMRFEAYDWRGNFVEEPPGLEVAGAQHALNPWSFSEPGLVKLCLEVPDDQPTGFRLSLISIAARVSSRNVQYSSSALIRP